MVKKVKMEDATTPLKSWQGSKEVSLLIFLISMTSKHDVGVFLPLTTLKDLSTDSIFHILEQKPIQKTGNPRFTTTNGAPSLCR